LLSSRRSASTAASTSIPCRAPAAIISAARSRMAWTMASIQATASSLVLGTKSSILGPRPMAGFCGGVSGLRGLRRRTRARMLVMAPSTRWRNLGGSADCGFRLNTIAAVFARRADGHKTFFLGGFGVVPVGMVAGCRV
jgi:hypothetical protein